MSDSRSTKSGVKRMMTPVSSLSAALILLLAFLSCAFEMVKLWSSSSPSSSLNCFLKVWKFSTSEGSFRTSSWKCVSSNCSRSFM